MGAKSDIEWTDASWTPIRARNLKTGNVGWYCEHATTGCEFCYAESMNRRLGTGLSFKPGHRKDVELFLDDEMLLAPLRWKKPRMIFVCSMTDLFADFVSDEWIDKIFAVMSLCGNHTFQVLTKRPERMRGYFTDDRRKIHNYIVDVPPGRGWANVGPLREIPNTYGIVQAQLTPLPNVWLGVSTERQPEADERIPYLLDTPAAVRFISSEPLLGAIDLRRYLDTAWDVVPEDQVTDPRAGNEPIDWVIVGGESSRWARPMNVEWVDTIVEQCLSADVPCFVKQLGTFPLSDGYPLELKNYKGGDPNEWPARLAVVRQMPKVAA